MPARLLSIQIARPQTYGRPDASETHDQEWTTGFFKTPVAGPILASTTNLAGDGQADMKHHGGVDKAVLAYSADHYPRWLAETGQQFPHGAFGENLTIAGLSEETVYIGDVYRIGGAVFEVSQPRQPCWKLARRWRMNELVALVIKNGRTGWYLRVIEEGYIEPGQTVTRLHRANADWPVARANRILHHHKKDLNLTLELAAVPRLADAWVRELRERADRLGTPAVT